MEAAPRTTPTTTTITAQRIEKPFVISCQRQRRQYHRRRRNPRSLRRIPKKVAASVAAAALALCCSGTPWSASSPRHLFSSPCSTEKGGGGASGSSSIFWGVAASSSAATKSGVRNPSTVASTATSIPQQRQQEQELQQLQVQRLLSRPPPPPPPPIVPSSNNTHASVSASIQNTVTPVANLNPTVKEEDVARVVESITSNPEHQQQQQQSFHPSTTTAIPSLSANHKDKTDAVLSPLPPPPQIRTTPGLQQQEERHQQQHGSQSNEDTASVHSRGGLSLSSKENYASLLPEPIENGGALPPPPAAAAPLLFSRQQTYNQHHDESNGSNARLPPPAIVPQPIAITITTTNHAESEEDAVPAAAATKDKRQHSIPALEDRWDVPPPPNSANPQYHLHHQHGSVLPPPFSQDNSNDAQPRTLVSQQQQQQQFTTHPHPETDQRHRDMNAKLQQLHQSQQSQWQRQQQQQQQQQQRYPQQFEERHDRIHRQAYNSQFPPLHQQQSLRPVQQHPQPVWKALWRRVEKGLDTLADVETRISNRAHQLVSTAVVVAPAVVATKIGVVPKQPQNQQAVQPMNMTRFQKSIPAIPPKNTVGNSQAIAAAPLATSRAIDWDSVKSGQVPLSRKTTNVMRANGGASNPQGTTHPMQRMPPDPNSPNQGHSTLGTRGMPSTTTPPPAYPGSNDPRRAMYSVSNDPNANDASSKNNQESQSQSRRSFLDDNDDDDNAWLQNFAKRLPQLPRLSLRFGRKSTSSDFAYATLDAWKADDDASVDKHRGLFSGLRRKKEVSIPLFAPRMEQKEVLTAPMTDFMQRLEKGDPTSLLNVWEEDQCRSLGCQKAFFDLLFLLFFLVGTKTLPDMTGLRLPATLVESLTVTITHLLSYMAVATDTWAPFAGVASYLAMKTRRLICERAQSSLSKNAESTIRDQSRYGSLFLRLTSSTAVDSLLPEKMQAAVQMQIASKVDIARLQMFVFGLVSTFLLSTTTALSPLMMDGFGALWGFLSRENLFVWPLPLPELAQEIRSLVYPLATSVPSWVGYFFQDIRENPYQYAFRVCLLASLVAIAYLPLFEAHRVHTSNLNLEMESDQSDKEFHSKFTEQVSSLGGSGAARLGLAAVDGRIDQVLERWRSMIPQTTCSPLDISFISLARFVSYVSVASILLSGPLLILHLFSLSSTISTKSLFPQWNSLFDVFAVLLLTYRLIWNALFSTVISEDWKCKVTGFIASLKVALEDRKNRLVAPPPNIQVQASLSPAAGLSVTDLWCSHVTKRAWAVRGASLSCRSGEVLVLLGDDGAGKTRLLTALVEAMVAPLRNACTTQNVRGSVAVSGLDVSKWDNKQLKRRLGISLCDARSTSDMAQIVSGLSIEEIIDPCAGTRSLDHSNHNSPGPLERAAMEMSLQITGLQTALIARLPSKLATIVTASEDDLQPSPLRPRYHMLSPAEWSKMLIARVFAQAIYDNSNDVSTSTRANSSSSMNTLVGSILLLDDPLLHCSEVEEARWLLDLRRTGAATVLSSHRWSAGRWADRIVVLQDGGIVETGTHEELLNRGPQHSVYAAKWHSMTTNHNQK